MGSRSRIRWQKVLKLGMGVFGCLALFLGLPNLIRRPEPPPLEPDIGLVRVAASREPAPSGQRPAPGPERRPAKGRDRPGGPRPEGQRRLLAVGPPTSRERVPPSTGSSVTGAPTPAPAPVPVPVPVSAADTAPAPAPPAPPPTAPPPARAVAPQPAAQTEFGFER
jgi:hypothetical protein